MTDPSVVNTSVGGTTAGTTASWSHTVGSGSNRVLVVAVDNGSDDNITGITFGAAALSLAKKNFPGAGARGQVMWVLLNPASGIDTITVTVSVASAGLRPVACDLQDVSQTGQPEVTAQGATSSTTLAATLTTITDRTLVIGVANGYYFSNAFAPGANTTLVVASDINVCGIFKSSSVITPTGSATLTTDWVGGGGAFDGAMIVGAFSPVVAAGDDLFAQAVM